MPRRPSNKGQPKSSRRKATRVPLQLKTYVNKAINRSNETKKLVSSYSLTSFNSGISVAGDILTILPGVTQGIASYQRIGTKIRIKKLIVRGHIILSGSATAGLQKYGVRQLVLKSKAYPSNNALVPSSELSYLLEAAGGSFTPFDGTAPTQLFQPINKKAFAVARDRKMYMYQQGTNPDDLSRSVKFFSMDIKQAQGKIVNYEFESGTATNFGWWMALGYVFLDGTVSNTTNVSMEYTCELTYEDA